MAESLLVGNTAFGLDLRRRHGVNLLAVRGRAGGCARLDRIRMRPGDVLLLQCPIETARQSLATLGCLPLAERELRIGQPQKLIPPLVIFVAALLLSAVGVVRVEITFVARSSSSSWPGSSPCARPTTQSTGPSSSYWER